MSRPPRLHIIAPGDRAVTNAELAEMYVRLGTTAAVAKELGIRPWTAWRLLSLAGVTMKRVRSRPSTKLAERVARILKMREGGSTIVEIAAAEGVSRARIYQIMGQHALDLPGRSAGAPESAS